MRRLGWPRSGLWRHSDFLRLWSAETVSQFGTQVSQLALPLTAVLVLDATALEWQPDCHARNDHWGPRSAKARVRGGHHARNEHRGTETMKRRSRVPGARLAIGPHVAPANNTSIQIIDR